MLSVDEAIAEILAEAEPLGTETVPLSELTGRIAVKGIAAGITQPPFDASAMDGYAVRFVDAAQIGDRLRVIGEAPAGKPFPGSIGHGEAVRIFTGGVVLPDADHVVIQEDVTRADDHITITAVQEMPRHIRKSGIDFKEGDLLVAAGETFHELHGAILAAANISDVKVLAKPRVKVFSNGDELVEPGSDLAPGQIINSNHYALCGMIEKWGGIADYIGRAPDDEKVLTTFFEKARDADIILPVGGASVGEYDYVKSAARQVGAEIRFEKVSVRPGKPTWYARLGSAHIVGIPGNPASAIVATALFVQPLIKRLGVNKAGEKHSFFRAKLLSSLPANGPREHFMRGEAHITSGDVREVTPVANQDSSLLSPFSKANVLIRRKANAPAVKAGDKVEIIRLRSRL